MIDPKTNTVVATYKSIREAERANYLGQLLYTNLKRSF